MIPVDSILSVIQFLHSVKMARDEQNIIIQRIKVVISTLSESLKQSIDFYFQKPQENKNTTLENFSTSLNMSKQQIEKISKRNCLSRYIKANDDLEQLKECYQLIQDSVNLIQAEKSILELVLVKQEVNQKTQQLGSIKQKVKDQNAQNFWTTYIGLDKIQTLVYDFVTKFYQIEFEKLENKEKIKKQYVICKLLQYVDQDGSGYADLEEVNEFYLKYWSNTDQQQSLIQEILKEQQKPILNKSQIMVSLLEQCNMEQLITKFLSLDIDSKIFLTMDYNSLQTITCPEYAIRINQAIHQHKQTVEVYKEIKQFCISIRPQAYLILEQYKQNPQEWNPSITGICKVYVKALKGDIVIQSVNGICSGPYVCLSLDYRYITYYGFYKYYDPETQERAAQSYECFSYSGQYTNFYDIKQEFQYFDKGIVSSCQQVNPFDYVFCKQTAILNKETGSINTIRHGPSITVDDQGNQVRQYFYYEKEVSLQDYIQLTKDNVQLNHPNYSKYEYKITKK